MTKQKQLLMVLVSSSFIAGGAFSFMGFLAYKQVNGIDTDVVTYLGFLCPFTACLFFGYDSWKKLILK